MLRSAGYSWSATPGTASMNCSTAGTRNALVMPSSANSRTILAGSMSRTMMLLHPFHIPAVAQPPPPMWNSGMATRLTLLSSSCTMATDGGTSATTLELVSSTPFGRPVVPLEYSWKATSSAAASMPGSPAGAAAMASS